MKKDRFGDELPEDSADPHNPDCRGGWLGTDLDDRPVPCLQCRPHLMKTVSGLGTRYR